MKKQIDIHCLWCVSSALSRLIAGDGIVASILLVSPSVWCTHPTMTMNIALGFCFPILSSAGLEMIFWCCAKVFCWHRDSALRYMRWIYSLINSEERVMGGNTNSVEIYDSWVGQKAAVDEASCTYCFSAAWSSRDGHAWSVKFYQLEEQLELAVQDQNFVIFSCFSYSCLKVWGNILLQKNILHINNLLHPRSQGTLYTVIPITLILMKKLVTEPRRIHPGDLTPCTLS